MTKKSIIAIVLLSLLTLGIALQNGGGSNVTTHDARLLEDLY